MWHRLIADTGSKNLIEKGLNFLHKFLSKSDKKPLNISHNVAVQTEINASKFNNLLSGWSKKPFLLENYTKSLVSKMKNMYSPKYSTIFQKSSTGSKIGKLSTLVVSYGFVGIVFNTSTTDEICLKDLEEDYTHISSLKNLNDSFNDNIFVLNEENEFDFLSNESSDIEVINCSENNEDVRFNDLEITKNLISKMGNEEKLELLQFLLQSSNPNDSETYYDNQLLGVNIEMCNMLNMDLKRMQSIIFKQKNLIKTCVEKFERMISGPTATEMQVLSYEMILNEGDEFASSNLY